MWCSCCKWKRLMSLPLFTLFETGTASKGDTVEIQTPNTVLSCNPAVRVLQCHQQASPRGCPLLFSVPDGVIKNPAWPLVTGAGAPWWSSFTPSWKKKDPAQNLLWRRTYEKCLKENGLFSQKLIYLNFSGFYLEICSLLWWWFITRLFYWASVVPTSSGTCVFISCTAFSLFIWVLIYMVCHWPM